MPYYTLRAEQFFFLPEQAKEQVQKYLQAHGINPDTTESFTIDGDLRGIAVLSYVLDTWGNAQLSPDGQSILHQEWIKLKDGEGPPPFLHHLVSSAGANSKQFVGDGRLLDANGKEIPR